MSMYHLSRCSKSKQARDPKICCMSRRLRNITQGTKSRETRTTRPQSIFLWQPEMGRRFGMGTGQKVLEHIGVFIRKKLNHQRFNPKLPGDRFALPRAMGGDLCPQSVRKLLPNRDVLSLPTIRKDNTGASGRGKRVPHPSDGEKAENEEQGGSRGGSKLREGVGEVPAIIQTKTTPQNIQIKRKGGG